MEMERCVAVVVAVVALGVCAGATVGTDGAQCSVVSGGCFHDAAGRLKTISNVSLAQCCQLCTDHAACKSYTHWLNGDGPLCNLFSDADAEKSAVPNCNSGRPGKTSKPNFIFVFPDTLRAESFNTYGNPVANVTPYLDKFAETAVRFDQAHVMHTQCSPSRCTMLTGRYMHILGHRTQTHLIQDYENNYFRELKEAGYHIQYYGKNDAFSATAFNLSVSNWTGMLGYASGSNAFQYPEPGYFSFLNTGSNTSGTDLSNADYRAHVLALEWLRSSPPEPFVLFIPTRGAHPPYGAPREWHNKFSPEEVKAKIQLRARNITGMPVYMSGENGIPKFRNLNPLPNDFFYKIQSVYLGMVSYTDWIFGQLLEGLDAMPGLSNHTAVFFSSDHGDFGGDFGLVEKWPGSMSDVLTRVPLYGRIPGGAKGHVSQAPVQTADVLETMLDLAGIDASWIRFGKSLKTQLNGGEGDMSNFVYSEGGFYFENEQMNEANECLSSCPKGAYCPRGQEEAQPNGSPRAVMMRNLTHKLVYRPTGVSELYDLRTDPREEANQFANPSYQTLRNEMLIKLLDWQVLTSDITPTYTDSRGPPRFPHPIPDDPWAAPLSQPSFMDLLEINGVIQD